MSYDFGYERTTLKEVTNYLIFFRLSIFLALPIAITSFVLQSLENVITLMNVRNWKTLLDFLI